MLSRPPNSLKIIKHIKKYWRTLAIPPLLERSHPNQTSPWTLTPTLRCGSRSSALTMMRELIWTTNSIPADQISLEFLTMRRLKTPTLATRCSRSSHKIWSHILIPPLTLRKPFHQNVRPRKRKTRVNQSLCNFSRQLNSVSPILLLPQP